MEELQSEAKAFYESTLREARKQIEIIDSKIEEELARVKEAINQLQEQKKATRLIYDGAASILGEKNEFDDPEKPQGK
jgi:precorrin-3B methylase